MLPRAVRTSPSAAAQPHPGVGKGVFMSKRDPYDGFAGRMSVAAPSVGPVNLESSSW